MNWLRNLFGGKRAPTDDSIADRLYRCFSCGKSLGTTAAGVYSGSEYLSALEASPYPCESCGTLFCIDCMSKLTKGSRLCPNCHQDVGWGKR